MRNDNLILCVCLFLFSQECFALDQENQNKYSSNQGNNTFLEQYEKWLPNPIISEPMPASSEEGPLMPSNLPHNMNFFSSGGHGYTNLSFGIYFDSNSGRSFSRLAGKNLEQYCPFPNFIERMVEFGYTTANYPVARYSIFPLLGRLYYIDSPDAQDDKSEWIGYAYRLKPEEYPKEVNLSHESFVFPYDGQECGTLHNYAIEILNIEHRQNEALLSARIYLRSPGSRKISRGGWYKIGDILQFYDKGHKIINIVAPRELKNEVRGHHCHLIGYIELAPEPIVLEKPHYEEVEILPEPSLPKPQLTKEEKDNMRIWHSVDGIEKEGVFIELRANNDVVIKAPDSGFHVVPLNTFSSEDQILIRQLATNLPNKPEAKKEMLHETFRTPVKYIFVLLSGILVIFIAIFVMYKIRKNK
jgi:hypothetical protein